MSTCQQISLQWYVLNIDFSFDLMLTQCQMFAYGLFCATILCSALQDITRDPSKMLPEGLNRATLIRNLSVFIADLELVCGPGNINHEFCAQASKAISKALDDVLNGVSTTTVFVNNVPNIGVLATPSSSSSLPALNEFGNASGLPRTDDLASMDFSNFDVGNFDLSDWSMNIDWTGTTGGWNIF